MLLALVLVMATNCRREQQSDTTELAPKSGSSWPVGSATAPPKSTSHQSWFTEITTEIGLDFVHESGVREPSVSPNGHAGSQVVSGRMPEVMLSGVALFDFDGDGDLDIYLTNGNRALPRLDQADDLGTANQLFRQEADGRFTNVTAASGLGDTGYGMGVAIGDMDNDGDLDVYVTNLGPDRLYRNRGDGTFEDVSEAMTIDVDGWSASACFVDYDADGFLDLYISRYVRWRPGKQCFAPDGRPTYCGPLAFLPIHDVLLHNDAGVTFTDVSSRAGIDKVKAAGLGVVCEDFNADGRNDVYVANDAYANQLWINQGDGTFRDEALERGAGTNLNGEPEAGMGVVSADFDNDGNNDLFMTHLMQESNTLYRNVGGDRGFIDVTSEVGMSWSSIPYTGFGTAAFDVELDGDIDIFLVNGRVKRGPGVVNQALSPPWNILAEPNLFYVNQGNGRFKQVTDPVASMCGPVEVTRGLAIGDLDSDGDLDIVLTNIQGPARVYRNDAPRQGAWLKVRAYDPRLSRDAIGARVTVVCAGRRKLRTVGRACSYLSSSDAWVHFGLGKVANVDRIEVDWQDGLREWFVGAQVNKAVELVRGSGTRQ